MATLRARAALLATVLAMLLILTGSAVPPADRVERVRAFTRAREFDYARWTVGALMVKFGQLSMGGAGYLDEPGRRDTVLDFLTLEREIQTLEGEIQDLFADPAVEDPEAASAALQAELEALYDHRGRLAPLAEAVLQRQLNAVLADFDLTLGGQSIPPALFHTTPLPPALIVSPREEIRQDANISLQPGLGVEERETLEETVDETLNVSSLVVPVGGVGIYPTMVMQTTDLNWLAEVIAHEWIHNYLTLRPLGMSYFASPTLRTMNETTASLAGKEIGRALIARYYPDFLPPPPEPDPDPLVAPETTPAEPPPFDFRAEMRETRVRVDELLSEGRVEEAEAYMEVRRRFLWDHGYRIRKLNQAYFAFYGAYADQPGGAAGEDPVGAAVRALRARSPTLAQFLNRIAWMTSFEQLQRALE